MPILNNLWGPGPVKGRQLQNPFASMASPLPTIGNLFGNPGTATTGSVNPLPWQTDTGGMGNFQSILARLFGQATPYGPLSSQRRTF